jgi:hypothetical protein
MMKKYIVPAKWKKIDKFTVVAPDGSKVWLDVRGLVVLKQPSGFSLPLGASFVDEEDDLRSIKSKSPLTNKIIQVYVGKVFSWKKEGYDTNETITRFVLKSLLKSIKSAVETLGYSVEYVDI